MTDQPYTPTKNQVGYAYVRTNALKGPDHQLWDEYHSFITTIEIAAEQRGAIKALRKAAKSLHDDDTAEYASAKYMRHIIYATWLEERADQIEQENKR